MKRTPNKQLFINRNQPLALRTIQRIKRLTAPEFRAMVSRYQAMTYRSRKQGRAYNADTLINTSINRIVLWEPK